MFHRVLEWEIGGGQFTNKISEAFGVRGASYDRLPWATFDDMLETYKLEVLNWPADVTWPGGDGRRDRGIEALSSTEVRKLLDALNHPTAPLSFRSRQIW